MLSKRGGVPGPGPGDHGAGAGVLGTGPGDPGELPADGRTALPAGVPGTFPGRPGTGPRVPNALRRSGLGIATKSSPRRLSATVVWGRRGRRRPRLQDIPSLL